MKRSYPSGSIKRKKRKDADKYLETLHKMTHFFMATGDTGRNVQSVEHATTAAAAASCEVALGEDNDVNQDNEKDIMLLPPTVTDSVIDDVDNDDDALVSQLPSPSPSCGNPAATDQSTVGLLTDDPALWPKKLTAEERCAIVRKGPIQISVLEFPKNQEGRRFTSNNYCFQMKNGEKINKLTHLHYSFNHLPNCLHLPQSHSPDYTITCICHPHYIYSSVLCWTSSNYRLNPMTTAPDWLIPTLTHHDSVTPRSLGFLQISVNFGSYFRFSLSLSL